MHELDPMFPADAAFYRGILDQMSDGVYFVDRNRRILAWSEGAHRLTGYTSLEVIGRCCQDEILCHVDYSGKRLCHDGCPLAACIREGTACEARAFLRHKQGRRLPVRVRVQPLRDSNGSIVGAIEIFSDDTAQTDAIRRVEEMRKMALLDHLTQLPNRRLLELSLHCVMNNFQTMGIPFGLLVLDLNEFKDINDRFGHAAGDRVLQEIAQTLPASLRPTDIVGRWGGDEFMAIIHNAGLALLQELARRCIVMVGEASVVLEPGATVRPSISVGLAVIRPGETAEGVFHRADQMMYRHKRKTRVMLPEAGWPSSGSDPKRSTSGRKSGSRPEVQSIF